MDTNRLKRFASEARNILIKGVNQRLQALGFQPDGSVAEKPELKGGGCVFQGDTQSIDFYNKFTSLTERLKNHSYSDIKEEVAYTWFNRLVAIRIMVKNELIPAVLEYESEDSKVPLIVSEARQGRMPQMNEETRQKLDGLLMNDALTDEQFQVLIVAFCHSNPVINKCFGVISDYSELLLPTNILSADGFIDRLNADDYISDEDYKSPELIGWLYQFYISERKDEVFAKKGKFEADEIPAATQIFTPNWIVKYMVQNTVGRIYLDNNPYSEIKESMKYLVEPAEPTPADAIYHFDDIHDLSCGDLGCGSGHIVNECFDLFFQIYTEEGYNARKAVEDIFHYNLIGVDIDTRAKQLATFALLMKACQKDKSFADAHCMPKILDMPEPFEDKASLRDTLPHFLLGNDKEMIDEIIAAIELMDNADSLGSIMKFNISERTRNTIAVRMDEYEQMDMSHNNHITDLMPYMRVILALTKKYSALVMNPPYMGGGNMNEVLSKYVKENYEDSKADLFSVFMDVAIDLLQSNGKYGMINMQSWMFLSSFEKLRKKVLDNQHIDSMLHLGPRTFDELSGEVVQNTAFVISKNMTVDAKGVYYRLVDGKNCGDKERMFLKHSENGAKIYYPMIPQNNFEKIPGFPISYWVNSNYVNAFIKGKSILEYIDTFQGIITGDNNRFLRYWQEVNSKKIPFHSKKMSDVNLDFQYWIPYNKGGECRKWYGVQDYVVYWKNGSKDKTRGKENFSKYYLNEYVAWSYTVSNIIATRYYPNGFLWDVRGSGIMDKSGILFYLQGLIGSIVGISLFRINNSTLSCQVENIIQLPILVNNKDTIDKIVKNNISISKLDWDSHETSWDFQTNELVSLSKEGLGSIQTSLNEEIVSDYYSLQLLVLEYKAKWQNLFNKLHANEEELNRQFIDIYGLQDELTPDVPLNEITILQQGEISIENNEIVWHDDVLMKQLISYAVGCMMGRYSIDKPGLILANQEDGEDEYKALVPNSRFDIDDDGIIPLMSANTEFTDNITLRFKSWLSITFGEESLVDNLNFIEQSLGKRLDEYFVKDYWKDHKKKYQNRPIYWLFSSKKGAFQCIVYMHRMNAYTAEKVRTKYLLPHIEWLLTKQSEMQANAANLSTRERKEMDNIGKQIEECREYHDRLHVIADKQIDFDLDDGVIVNHAKFGDVLQKLK